METKMKFDLILNFLKNEISYVKKVVNRIPKRKRKLMKLATISAILSGAILCSLWIIYNNYWFLGLAYVPIFGDYVYMSYYQKKINKIRGIFLKINTVDNFNEWKVGEIMLHLKESGIITHQKLEHLITNLEESIKVKIPIQKPNKLLIAAIPVPVIFFLIEKALRNPDSTAAMIYDLKIIFAVTTITLLIMRFKEKLPRIVLFFKNELSEVRDLEDTLKILKKAHLEDQIIR